MLCSVRRARSAPSLRSIRPASLASAALALVACTASAWAKDVILNEWNCVGSEKWLGNPGSPVPGCPMPDGPAGVDCSNNDDTFFGRVQGNGGDWIEIVIIKDHMDLRGWKIQWIEPGEDDADGTDIWYGDGSVPQGEITFSNDAMWSDLRKGTILTITESPTADGGLDTDFGFDPCNGDWWINVNVFDARYVSAVSNVDDPDDPPGYVDPFDVGNGNWQARIVTPADVVHVDLVGEAAAGWAGSGVNSREVVKLRQDPSTSINEFSDYRGGDTSTFGSPNSWSDTITDCRTYQDFTAIRASVYAELCSGCHPIWLNEYNAVGSDEFLNGGTQALDGDGGQASDAFFGRVLGNGGNWFELVVGADHLDLRGWRLRWFEVEDGTEGEIVLTNHAFWSDLRAGTILTFIERTTAEGGLDTDVSIDFGAGDRWANVNTFDTTLVASTTSSDREHVSGEFTTSNDKWQLEMRNGADVVEVPWAGEGSPHYYRGGVSATEVCRLRQHATPAIDASSAYDDSAASSTFGAPNTWTNCPSTVVISQSFTALPSAGCVFEPRCGVADINCDGAVDGNDLAIVLGQWGPCSGCPGDINDDGMVDGSDLAVVLGQWG